MRSFRVRVAEKTFLIEVEDFDQPPIHVKVDGRPYQVDVDWLGAASEATVTPQLVPSTSPQEARVPSTHRPLQAPEPQVSEREQEAAPTIDAPMPGTIVDIAVKAGQHISRGDEVCLLEAMKMRNSIKSSRDGQIAEVVVSAGQKVAYGDVLVRFAEAQP